MRHLEELKRLYKGDTDRIFVLTDRTRDDKHVMEILIRDDFMNIRYCSRRLKDDEQFLTTLFTHMKVREYEMAIKYISPRLRNIVGNEPIKVLKSIALEKKLSKELKINDIYSKQVKI